ncbi:MAG TPA: acyloxyacyl hydrolase [Syntrophales bacterium]|nr:acyloxyacyl hydrolase [Syntrophales bacterium]
MRGKKNFRRAVALAAFLVLFCAGAGWSAEARPSPRITGDGFFTEVGFVTGFGYSTVSEGKYLPVPLIVHLGTDMGRWFPSLANNRGVLTVFLEPQVNPVFGYETRLEAGAGIGLKYRYPLTDALSVYGLYSAGFLFLTANTVDQANGLNFANSVGAGISVRIMPGAALDLGFRIRHVSNADLREPNCGIDSYIGMIGFMFTY